MDSAFGLTARQSFKHNLTPGEIAGQVITLKHKTPEGANINNIVNAHDDKTRSSLMPINKKYPLATLLKACEKYSRPKATYP